MKEIEATRLKLAAMELVEGTGLEWWEFFKVKGVFFKQKTNLNIWATSEIELALGIIEGKPVWAGDTPYFDGKKTVVYPHYLYQFNKDWSWLPPKPRTAMVELLVEDIEAYEQRLSHIAAVANLDNVSARILEAFRKTLEGLK